MAKRGFMDTVAELQTRFVEREAGEMRQDGVDPMSEAALPYYALHSREDLAGIFMVLVAIEAHMKWIVRILSIIATLAAIAVVRHYV